MTISIRYTDGSAATELEVIRARAGVEVRRDRVMSDTHGGAMFSTGLDGSETLILREVTSRDALAPAPGETRHGGLDATSPAPGKALEDGDVDPFFAQLVNAADEARDRVIELAEKLIDLDVSESQQQVYGELSEAVKVNIDAGARLEAYMGGLEEYMNGEGRRLSPPAP